MMILRAFASGVSPFMSSLNRSEREQSIFVGIRHCLPSCGHTSRMSGLISDGLSVGAVGVCGFTKRSAYSAFCND